MGRHRRRSGRRARHLKHQQRVCRGADICSVSFDSLRVRQVSPRSGTTGSRVARSVPTRLPALALVLLEMPSEVAPGLGGRLFEGPFRSPLVFASGRGRVESDGVGGKRARRRVSRFDPSRRYASGSGGRGETDDVPSPVPSSIRIVKVFEDETSWRTLDNRASVLVVLAAVIGGSESVHHKNTSVMGVRETAVPGYSGPGQRSAIVAMVATFLSGSGPAHKRLSIEPPAPSCPVLAPLEGALQVGSVLMSESRFGSDGRESSLCGDLGPFP